MGRENQKNNRDLKGTWWQALSSLFFPILALVCFRWLVFEPFIIPSGSMIPNLLVHDHILVDKFSFGVRKPFSTEWLVFWSGPQRGDVVVFHYPLDPQTFYIKRVVGLPGDLLEVRDGRIRVNGEPWSLTDSKLESATRVQHNLQRGSETAPIGTDFEKRKDVFLFWEKNHHWVRFQKKEASANSLEEVFEVPEGKYFMMGDNRDESRDSRTWGFVDKQFLVGRAHWIWLSCEDTLASSPMGCDPLLIRWKRMFSKVQ